MKINIFGFSTTLLFINGIIFSLLIHYSNYFMIPTTYFIICLMEGIDWKIPDKNNANCVEDSE